MTARDQAVLLLDLCRGSAAAALGWVDGTGPHGTVPCPRTPHWQYTREILRECQRLQEVS